eukprot:CAMPEP_0197037066 /NCGR_PEP_ID=MMETSP1384-20130603/14366_1 /TAXON_ID=29189 /ORGANISM="Ammonia sp." /LENGTH=456 /DNA_ID=CAMNT_0042467319 /DNA_START=49 /DNA_END=1419 /DNA_ORIENTATION=-
MDALKQLAQTHKEVRSIEHELNKCRIQLIKNYQHRSNLDLLYEYLSVWKSYQRCTVQLKQETAKFESILSDSIISLNTKLAADLACTENNSEYNEIMSNLENVSKESESSPDSDCSAYDDSSLHANTHNSSHNSSNQVQLIHAPHSDEADEEDELEQPQQPPQPHDPDQSSFVSIDATNEQPAKLETDTLAAMRTAERTDSTQHEQAAQIPIALPIKSEIAKADATRNEQTRKYVYGGTGFRVFMHAGNHRKPIYSSTLLYCTEVCGKEKRRMSECLIKYGRFKQEMILSVSFKTSWNGQYALIRVKAPWKVLKQKIKAFNKNFMSMRNGKHQENGGDGDGKVKVTKRKKNVLSVFQSRNHGNYHDSWAPSSVVYVYNFDILGVGAHKAFTQLFLKYGDLKEDIAMKLDKYGEPFAIVKFREMEDAMRCVEQRSRLQFGERRLNLSYSQAPDDLYR